MISGNIFPVTEEISQRLEDLRKSKKWSKLELCRRLGGIDPKTYRNWINRKDGISISLSYAVALADVYEVSVDYILCRTDYTHVGNKEVCEITGLSDKSVEVLRYLNTSPNAFNNIIAHNRLNTLFINNVFEYVYPQIKGHTDDEEEDLRPVSTIFLLLQEYIYGGNVTVSTIDSKEEDIFTFNPEQSDVPVILGAREAYEAFRFTHIIEELTAMKKAQKKKEVE